MSEVGITDNLLEWNLAAVKYVDDFGMAPQVVLPKQMGYLARTLINLTPPKNRSAMNKIIDRKVAGKFVALNNEGSKALKHAADSESGHTSKNGTGSIFWYSFWSDEVFGVDVASDYTGATADELWELYKKTQVTSEGRVVLGNRGKQTFYIWKRYLTTKRQREALAKRIKGHGGRLKAGWVVGWRAMGAPEGGQGPVPDWVLKHETGARGYVIDGLGVPNYPSVTIANYAVGATEQKLGPIKEKALQLRVQAMRTDITLYCAGIKH